MLAFASIVGAALAVLLFARVGGLRGDRVTVYIRSNEARGVLKGTEVWLLGQKVGRVEKVEFLLASEDTTHRVVIEAQILEPYDTHIRHDSPIQIRPGSSLIGAPVVAIDAGTGAAKVLEDGDTVTASPQGDTEGVASQIALASRDFPAIIGNVKALNAQLDQARGTAGAVMNDQQGMRELDVLRGRAGALTRDATKGQGTIGRALQGGGGALGARVKHAMAQADSVRELVSSGTSSVGRFRRDSTLLAAVGGVRAEISIVRAMLKEPRGTAGRVRADSAITRELGRLERELGILMDDIKRRPQRYVSF